MATHEYGTTIMGRIKEHASASTSKNCFGNLNTRRYVGSLFGYCLLRDDTVPLTYVAHITLHMFLKVISTALQQA